MRSVSLVDAMKFRERFRPEVAVIDRGNLRPHLEHVWLDVDKKRLAATNGHLMVFVPCEVEPDDVSGFVPVEAIEYARHHGPDGARSYDWVEMACRERIECRGASFERPKPDAPFPPVDQVAARQQPGDPGTVTLALDARYLRRIAAALGGEDEERGGPAHVRLVVKVPADPREPMLQPMAVVCNDDADGERWGLGTLMPCRATISPAGTEVALLAAEPTPCGACGHQHSGPEMGRICIGCACQEGVPA